MKALFIAAGAVGAAAAVTATVLVSAGGSAPAATRPAGLYLYIGNREKTPVQRPDVIHTAQGDIMVGEGKLPPGYGLSGTDYPGWYWTPGNAQLTWANLNNSDTVIQNVKTDPLGVGNVVTLTGGGKTVVCLSYQSGVAGSHVTWLVLNPALDWMAVTDPSCPYDSKFTGEQK